MAKPLYSGNIPHRVFVPTRWAYPKEPLGVRTDGQEIDYSETIEMQSGGGEYWTWCSMNREICGHVE